MRTVTAVGAVFVFVDDLAAGAQWYSTLFGVEQIDADTAAQHPQLATFDLGGCRLVVHAADDYNRAGDGAGPVAYWGTDDLDDVLARAVQAGGRAHRGPKTIFTGERLVQILDPFGNLFGLRQPA